MEELMSGRSIIAGALLLMAAAISAGPAPAQGSKFVIAAPGIPTVLEHVRFWLIYGGYVPRCLSSLPGLSEPTITLLRRTNMSAINSVATLSRPFRLVVLADGVLLAMALTVGLWAYYGTAVFFEMVRAGWAACF